MNSQQHPTWPRRHRADCKCECDRQTLAITGVFDRPEFRAALAARDMAGVFHLLKRCGYSQRRVASLTGQSQSEISEILAGRRVTSYDLLVRIADGLGVPRGWMGLAYDTPDGEPPQQQ